MKNTILTFVLLFVTSISFSQFARVQVIHNSADLALAEVDVYLNNILALDDVPFRSATAFLDVPSGMQITIDVAPSDSTNSGDSIFNTDITFTNGETYVIIADGIWSATGYDPAPPLSMEIYNTAREAAINGSNVDLLVHHGSTDAPTVDIVETDPGSGTLVDDISYTDYQGYLELPTLDYIIEVRDETGSIGLEAYQVPLQTLNLTGSALTVIASGFFDPSQNSNGPAFGLFVASPVGGLLLELPGAPLGVEDENQLAFSIYPNPTKKFLQIENVNLTLERQDFLITDMQGRIVLEGELNETDNRILVESLSSGLYLLNLYEGDELLGNLKFIKE